MQTTADIRVVIPVLNERKSLPKVLRDIPLEPERIVVVDNGSTDGSGQVAREFGATVVEQPRRGYGSACLAGLDHIRREGGCDVVAFVDADYSDYPDQMPRVVEPIFNEGVDLVVGSRMLGQRQRGALAPQAYWGNKLAVFLLRWLYGVEFTDLGPFRAMRWSSMELIGMKDRDYGWTVEMQLKAARAGLRCKEVPVDYRRRIGRSKITGTVSGTVLASYKILFTIGRYALTPAAAWKRPAISPNDAAR